MKVLGLDPSMSNFGMVLAELDISRGELDIQSMILSETKSTKQKQVRKNSDDLERARGIQNDLEPMLNEAQMVFVEVPHGSQSARAMASYGMCIGILSRIQQPLIQLTERELKLATVGSKTATKDEMIEWAVSQQPEADWMIRAGKLIKKNEHLADAYGAIVAGMQTDDFKSAMAILSWADKKQA